jgi:hypothetical protein
MVKARKRKGDQERFDINAEGQSTTTVRYHLPGAYSDAANFGPGRDIL